MKFEKKDITELIPAEYNPRKDLKPGDEEYEKLRKSLEQFGYVEPIIWNSRTGHVVGGHQRLKVLIDMGMPRPTLISFRHLRTPQRRRRGSPQRISRSAIRNTHSGVSC